LREDHLRSLAKLVGANYLRLNTPDALKTAMLDRRFAQIQPADTDLRWIPALLALLLLAWRFAPELGWRREKRKAAEGAPGGLSQVA
jgi:mxaL protein